MNIRLMDMSSLIVVINDTDKAVVMNIMGHNTAEPNKDKPLPSPSIKLYGLAVVRFYQ